MIKNTYNKFIKLKIGNIRVYKLLLTITSILLVIGGPYLIGCFANTVNGVISFIDLWIIGFVYFVFGLGALSAIFIGLMLAVALLAYLVIGVIYLYIEIRNWLTT